jgi:hypothetical protein
VNDGEDIGAVIGALLVYVSMWVGYRRTPRTRDTAEAAPVPRIRLPVARVHVGWWRRVVLALSPYARATSYWPDCEPGCTCVKCGTSWGTHAPLGVPMPRTLVDTGRLLDSIDVRFPVDTRRPRA